MRSKLVVGNWKMHGNLSENAALLGSIIAGVTAVDKSDCAVCVPYSYLAQAQALLRDTRIAWGAQNVSQHPKGAFTGEVSAAMLAEFGCRYVIVGHSERRCLYHEDSFVVAEKFKAAQAQGLVPILCVGETLEQREAGRTEQVVAEQLDAVLAGSGPAALGNAVLAYEPVWAIGTGKTASPEQAQGVHEFIRKRVGALDQRIAQRLQVLYGGSVKASNSAELFSMPDIDGGLIGGASLIAEEFLAICRSAH
jgi:triosephosphate isomerase